jgi:hypothetical protein
MKSMTNLVSLLLMLAFFAGFAVAQDSRRPIPAGLAVFTAYNQLGTPRWTGGFSAIYPVRAKVGVYATTTADVYPKQAVDPVTGRQFYAISASTRQGIHYRLLDMGNSTFLAGGDIGPSFSQQDPTGIKVSLTSSFVMTTVHQLTPVFGVIAPLRILYVSGVGWNPVFQAGVVINLQNIPKGK